MLKKGPPMMTRLPPLGSVAPPQADVKILLFCSQRFVLCSLHSRDFEAEKRGGLGVGMYSSFSVSEKWQGKCVQEERG